MSEPRSRLVAATGIAMLVLGCGGAHPHISETAGHASGARRVVVAPMNLAVPLPIDLVDAVEPVTAELLGFLRGLNLSVAAIWAPDAVSLWRDVEGQLTTDPAHPPPFEAIAPAFARSVAAETRYDLLLLPALVFREAEVLGRTARWDGVRRRIRFIGAGPTAAAELPQPSDTQIERSAVLHRSFRGHITGLSLHVVLIEPDGKIAYQQFGGLDLMHAVMEDRDRSKEPSLRLQPDALADTRHLREGVQLALGPYLERAPANP